MLTCDSGGGAGGYAGRTGDDRLSAGADGRGARRARGGGLHHRHRRRGRGTCARAEQCLTVQVLAGFGLTLRRTVVQTTQAHLIFEKHVAFLEERIAGLTHQLP